MVDLMGGQFAVSQTLWFGSGGGVRLTGGSLRATDNFTVGQPLVAVQGEGLEVRALLLSFTVTLAVAHAPKQTLASANHGPCTPPFKRPLRGSVPGRRVMHAGTAAEQLWRQPVCASCPLARRPCCVLMIS